MTEHQRSRPLPAMTWTARINLSDEDAEYDVHQLSACRQGGRVILDVGRLQPWDSPGVDAAYRLAHRLVDIAGSRGLLLELEGTPEAISAWWRLLDDLRNPAAAFRHLHAVSNGAGQFEIRPDPGGTR